MFRVHSHYDNLKVTRDATPEAIRAAYRTLTRRHHPDRNPDNPEAARVMAIVNVAYSVLSDPTRRREHDAWIDTVEQGPMTPPRPPPRASPPHAPSRPPTGSGDARARARHAALEPVPWPRDRSGRIRIARRLLVASVAGSVLVWGGLQALDWSDTAGRRPVAVRIGDGISSSFAMPPSPSLASTDARGAPVAAPRWARGTDAPNGQAWPAGSAYIPGYALLNDTGRSEVTVDNRRNPADMFVKLFALDGPGPQAVRTFVVGAGGRFNLGALTSGTYDLRYRNLETGVLTRSSPFILEEVNTSTGVQHSSVGIALDPPGEGSPRAYTLTEAEF